MIKPYQFGKGKSRKEEVRKIDASRFTVEKSEEPSIGLVQGIKPDSVQEWRVALALMRRKVDFRFQYAVSGGRSVRGGQVIDFLVYTVPLATPLYVNGDYWHNKTNDPERAFKLAEMKRLTNGQFADPVELWEHEIPTVDAAISVLRRKLGV